MTDEQAAEKVRAALDVLRSSGPAMGGWRLSENDHHRNCHGWRGGLCDCYATAHQPGRDALSALAAELVSLKDALIDTYALLRSGETDNALHALDAFLIQLDINPDVAAREALGSQA